MKGFNLTETGVENLQIVTNNRDIRRALHSFCNYVAENSIKRSVRDNTLPKAQLKRIAKSMSDASLLQEIANDQHSHWLDFIDKLSLKLEFIKYQCETETQDYNSYNQSYAYNYMSLYKNNYHHYLELSLQAQENKLLNTLINEASACKNEFFTRSPLSQLDKFSSAGCATGVMQHIDFPKVRRHLLDVLCHCKAGIWYSTASLIEYLKHSYPFFLIPKKVPLDKHDAVKQRYHNFMERKPGDAWGKSWKIDQQQDCFERVEGRFIERFLEGLPLTMGYVEVAYCQQDHEIYPSLHRLKAFRITDALLCASNGTIEPPKITVLANYEIHIDSLFYPAKALQQLSSLCTVDSLGVHSVLRPVRKKIIKQLVEDDKLDVNILLTELSGRELPANVQNEIASWSAHADNFIVYRGFGLLEGEMDKETASRNDAITIAPHLHMIREPKKLVDQLETKGRVPLYTNHSDTALKSFKEDIQSKFAKQSKGKKSGSKKKKYTLKRTVYTIIEFPDKEIYAAFIEALPDNNLDLGTNKHTKTVSYLKKDANIIMRTLNSLGKKYSTVINDV